MSIRTPLLAALVSALFSISSATADPLPDQLAAAREKRDTNAERELLLRLLEKSPRDAELLRALAKVQLSSSENERCSMTLGRLEAVLGKADADLLEMRGDVARATAANDAERTSAAGHWQAALVLEPERVSALAKLARHNRGTQQPAAEALYRERLIKLRNDPEDHTSLARVAAGRREWDALIRHSTHLRTHHANRDVAKKWAAVYDRLMKLAASLAALDARLEAQPNSAETLLERAWLFDGVGIKELSLKDARRARKHRPASFVVKFQLAVIMARAGEMYAAHQLLGVNDLYRYTRKKRVLTKLIAELTALEAAAADGDASALAQRSELLRAELLIPLAYADAKAAVAADPRLLDAQLALARCENELYHTAAAKVAYEAALRIDAVHFNALKELGHLHETLGDYDKAETIFARHEKLGLGEDYRAQREYHAARPPKNPQP